MERVRYSLQREVVFDTIMSERKHFTADDIYARLKVSHPKLSLGTVYRNLQYLSDTGRVRKITLPNDVDRYDGNIEDHYHLICTICESITDLEIDYFSDIDKIVSAKYGLDIDKHNLVFYHKCRNCMCSKS